MQGITFGKPEPFAVPDYDFDAVRKIAQATDLSSFYGNVLSNAFDRDQDDFTYGLPASITKQLVERVQSGFEWSEWAEKIKQMGRHYKVGTSRRRRKTGTQEADSPIMQLRVSGIPDQGDLTVHFVHRESPATDGRQPIPLLLVHGWPGSFLEFEEISKLLSDRGYSIVMPSIPGYAFSDAPKRAAKTEGGSPWNYTKTATCFNAIMLSLGYDKYVTQGGDWVGWAGAIRSPSMRAADAPARSGLDAHATDSTAVPR